MTCYFYTFIFEQIYIFFFMKGSKCATFSWSQNICACTLYISTAAALCAVCTRHLNLSHTHRATHPDMFNLTNYIAASDDNHVPMKRVGRLLTTVATLQICLNSQQNTKIKRTQSCNMTEGRMREIHQHSDPWQGQSWLTGCSPQKKISGAWNDTVQDSWSLFSI